MLEGVGIDFINYKGKFHINSLATKLNSDAYEC